jgi:hypothetical protein
MTFLADENFPRPALLVLREAGNDVRSVAEDCPRVFGRGGRRPLRPRCVGSADLDKDFGELVFRRGLRWAIILVRTWPGENIRIISARPAQRHEHNEYEAEL